MQFCVINCKTSNASFSFSVPVQIKHSPYLADIDKQAQERLETLTEQMKQAQGITEQLKAENALEWTGRMNNIRACAREIVNREIIYN